MMEPDLIKRIYISPTSLEQRSIAPRDPQVYVYLSRVECMEALSLCIIAPRDPQVYVHEEVDC